MSTLSEKLEKQFVLDPKNQKINMGVHTNAPTTIPDLTSAKHVFMSPDQASNKVVSV